MAGQIFKPLAAALNTSPHQNISRESERNGNRQSHPQNKSDAVVPAPGHVIWSN
jgi:hypothetical protein